MKDVKITVLKMIENKDLIKEYENPEYMKKIENRCIMHIGDSFISKNAQIPNNFCNSAWHDLSPYVEKLANGVKQVYDNWMIKDGTAIISCNDGLHPVIFLLEVM